MASARVVSRLGRASVKSLWLRGRGGRHDGRDLSASDVPSYDGASTDRVAALGAASAGGWAVEGKAGESTVAAEETDEGDDSPDAALGAAAASRPAFVVKKDDLLIAVLERRSMALDMGDELARARHAPSPPEERSRLPAERTACRSRLIVRSETRAVRRSMPTFCIAWRMSVEKSWNEILPPLAEPCERSPERQAST